MYRQKLVELEFWKIKKNRKPLIINGARQVGKSWLVKEFAKTYTKGNFININFEKTPEIHKIFELNYDIERIILELELVLNIKINPKTDLLFLDELQIAPKALGSLRYFYEDKPELHVIAAGSLLDFEFRDQPFPVGRVETLDMHPLNFIEFLLALKEDILANFLLSGVKEISEAVNEKLNYLLNTYMLVGGMPEAVYYYCNYNDLVGVKSIQKDLLYTYEQDFRKYKANIDDTCLQDIITSTSKQIGQQIIYTKLSDKYNGPTIKKGLGLLKTARLLNAVQNVSVSGLPFTSLGKQLKIYHLDIGLLLQKLNIDIASLYVRKELTTAFAGALAEQFVAQQIISNHQGQLCYWARTQSGANAEVDFVINLKGKITPIEVKAGKSGSLKSLHYLLENHPNVENAIVYSNAKYGINNKIHFVPIYFAGLFKTANSENIEF